MTKKTTLLIICFLLLLTFQTAFTQAEEINSATPPVIPVGADAYTQWHRWPYQRIGVRAYMRSTYDRRGGNESADASHFLYQLREDFNVTLDVENPGMLYFARYNHWHGSPWHYEVDGKDHIVKETTTANPRKKLKHSVFIPENIFHKPLAYTYATTKGADLSWVPIGFQNRFRMAYSRTFYGTGYYIYHQYNKGAKLSRPIRTWDGKTPADAGIAKLLNRAGTDISPKLDKDDPKRGSSVNSRVELKPKEVVTLAKLGHNPQMIRSIKFSSPAAEAVQLGKARIRITWDDRKQPSVDAPLALFFGTGTFHNREKKEYLVKALPVNVRFADDRIHLACYFPMPFYKSAKIELVGPPEKPLTDFKFDIQAQHFDAPLNHVAYFHATYADHAKPKPGHDLVFLDTKNIEGEPIWSGNFVGTSFIFSDRGMHRTLEGDPRFFFDDSQTPQAQGTGTEEWGGGGDYWGGRTMTLPLAGHPVGIRKPEQAKNKEELIESAYRFLLGDLMPFGRRAVIRMEHGGRNNSTEHYQSVTYWYGVPSATLELTDELNVGDAASEKTHHYHSPKASEPYKISSRYEWGPDSILSRSANSKPLSKPKSFADFQFKASADKKYYIWLRGTTAGNILTDATWIQFNEHIGTTKAKRNHLKYGFGNWRDLAAANKWSWSSQLPQSIARSIRFEKGGEHRMRVQLRHGTHYIDKIWLSTTQVKRPKDEDFIKAMKENKDLNQIVLSVSDATKLSGSLKAVKRDGALSKKAIQVGKKKSQEIFPAQSKIGRVTTTSSEFNLKLNKDNLGVMLRRTLDYQYPNQRAKVYVADTTNEEPDWKYAGIWYTAGSNTCYYSYPYRQGELGKTNPVVQTSNRRFRDDEFLLPLELTKGKSAIRVRVEFTPVKIPLLPGRKIGKLAWSEIKYQAYCYRMPTIKLKKD